MGLAISEKHILATLSTDLITVLISGANVRDSQYWFLLQRLGKTIF